MRHNRRADTEGADTYDRASVTAPSPMGGLRAPARHAGSGHVAALPPRPPDEPNGVGPGVAVTPTLPQASRTIDKVDEVFLRLLIIYQSQGLDAARQFARDQGLMTPKEDVRITLVLDSDDPAVVDGTALAGSGGWVAK